jgi:CxxC motif-containing protein
MHKESAMVKSKQFICIGCPIGCPLQLQHEGSEITEITGYECNRGAKYARQEFTDPRRSLSTTIAISHAKWRRLPVKVTEAVEKDRIMEAVFKIHELQIEAPVRLGQVLIKDLLGEKNINVVACRSMERVNGE